MSNQVIGTFIFDQQIIIVKEKTVVVIAGDEVIEIPNTKTWIEEAEK